MKNACMQTELLFALSHGMLSERDEQEGRRHLHSCASCREVFESYRRLDAVLDEWSPAAEPSPWFDARLRAAAAASRPARSIRSFLGFGRDSWMAAPALAALLAAASVVIIRDARLRSPSPAPPAAPVSVASTLPPEAAARSQAGAQEIKLYQNLPVLEDYDMLADFDVISDLPQGSHKVAD